MGNRLTKIYTRTGDQGTTGLGDGVRVDKDNARIEAIGTIDELNCALGQLVAHDLPDTIAGDLILIQHSLFDIGGELSLPGTNLIADERVARLETILDTLNAELSPLREFILPGGTPAAAACHAARALCRRAERRLITLNKSESINGVTLRYLNRLSDLLFVMARCINKRAGRKDVLWERH